MAAWRNPINTGFGWAQGILVDGSEPNDVLIVTMRRPTSKDAPFEVAREVIGSDGFVQIIIPGDVSKDWLPGYYDWQFSIKRGQAAGVFAVLPPIEVRRTFSNPGFAYDPLLAPGGEPLRLEVVGDFSPNITISLVAGIRGADGVGSGGNYRDHTQLAPSDVWTIAHNLGTRPGVTAFSPGGVVMVGEVVHLSDNVLTITFLSPVAGSAHLT